ncbi:MAG: hypothetical protein JXA21_17930 [Anaerolineae bacterium]|nr:hypothetical protein [Anaerolineae bacterium]
MKIIPYKGWQTCYQLSNGLIDIVVTGDVGPRVIRLGFVEDVNELYENPEWLGRNGNAGWINYGGHRLWHAPEVNPRTYAPDNDPVTVEQYDEFVRFVQRVEPQTGIQKEIDIALNPGKAHVRVLHRLRNTTPWEVELAPWALTVMAAGGKAIMPLPPRGSHSENLLPTNIMTLWAYTNMADSRWTWGNKYVMLQQDSGAANPQKIGLWVPDGWAAYANRHHLFVKTFTPCTGAPHPDFGCNVETFTNKDILEVETLGPLTKLAPGAAVEYEENWYLFKDVPLPAQDGDVDTYVLPKVQQIRG